MPNTRLLIAEDDRFLLSSLSFHLSSQGYEVLEACNGQEAMKQLLRSKSSYNPVDILMTDIQMPQKNGFELISEMAQLEIDIPVLVFSGYGDKETLLQLLRLGCEDFLDKPFEPDDLTGKIEELLNRRRRQEKKDRNSGRIAERDLKRLVEDYRRSFEDLKSQVSSAAATYRNLISFDPKAYKANIACRHMSYQDLGGDLVDIRETSRGMDVIIADVAGHDLAASYQAVMVKSFFDENCRSARSGMEFFQILNKALLENSGKNERMVTALFLRLDFIDMEAEVVSAGHPELIRYSKKVPVARPVHAKGDVLGLLDKVGFKHRIFSLEHGERLFLYTDGIPNASYVDGPSGEKQSLSADGLDDFITRESIGTNDIETNVERVWNSVLEFCQKRHNDDMLLLGIEVP